MPLRRLIDHIDILAAGDLSRPAPQVSQFNREVTQLSSRIAAMQQGLCALVQQVNDATTAMVGNINELAQNNKQLYQQSAKQSEELSSVTSHISLLECMLRITVALLNWRINALCRREMLRQAGTE
jgi:methyl-accepting chemotaxis protein-1 (serine sensor receptor)